MERRVRNDMGKLLRIYFFLFCHTEGTRKVDYSRRKQPIYYFTNQVNMHKNDSVICEDIRI